MNKIALTLTLAIGGVVSGTLLANASEAIWTDDGNGNQVYTGSGTDGRGFLLVDHIRTLTVSANTHVSLSSDGMWFQLDQGQLILKDGSSFTNLMGGTNVFDNYPSYSSPDGLVVEGSATLIGNGDFYFFGDSLSVSGSLTFGSENQETYLRIQSDAKLSLNLSASSPDVAMLNVLTKQNDGWVDFQAGSTIVLTGDEIAATHKVIRVRASQKESVERAAFELADGTGLTIGESGALAWSDSEDGYSTLIYTAAIPEPSTFGLLAGLGAIAFVVSRRRRRARKMA